MLGNRFRKLPFSGNKQVAVTRCSAALADAPTKASKQLPVSLPASLSNSVAILDAPNSEGGTTKVYVMGVSHVSKDACEQVKELIRLVEPEVVMVELCRDRLGLLVSSDLVTQAAGIWHCRKVYIDGIPKKEENPEFPSSDDMKPLLITRPGRPVTTQDIETDVFTLLGTGLFKNARPLCQNPSPDEAPEFGVRFSPEDGSAVVRCIPPLGAVRYAVTERVLPPVVACTVRVDSSLKSFPYDESALEDVCKHVVAECKKGEPSLRVMLRAKALFADAFVGGVNVVYNNAETGKVEVILKATKSTDAPYISGFEASAGSGEGWGIDLFRPQRPMQKISDRMFLTAELLDKMREASQAGLSSVTPNLDGAELAKKRRDGIQSSSQFRIWSAEEAAAAKRPELGPDNPVTGNFVAAMTLLYAKYQAAAGRKVGIEKGAAWQAALQAASEVGAQQFLLSDRPISVTDYRLGEQMGPASGARVAGALTAIIGVIVVASMTSAAQEMELAGVGVAIAAAAALLWPVLAPFAEIAKLADMSAKEIEGVLTPKSPITADLSKPAKLFGEDALLDWPGAMGPIIDDRDEYMAKAAAAAAQGRGYSPAFVLDQTDGQLLWRYMQAEGAPPEASPSGFGDGAYKPLPAPRAIVSVVGTAHVPGIVRMWPKAVEASEDVMALLRGKNAQVAGEATPSEVVAGSPSEAGGNDGEPAP